MFNWFKKQRIDDSIVPEIDFVRIEAGTFVMGQGPDDPEPDGTAPQHKVTLTRAFKIGTTPITRDQFSNFVDATRYRTSAEESGVGIEWWNNVNGASWRTQKLFGSEILPATFISWGDATAYCKWASRATRSVIRLPTEAEWEYACRGGTTTAYAGNLEAMGWFADNSGDRALDSKELAKHGSGVFFKTLQENNCRVHGVKLKQPNRWGLYDMHGNIWEWCSDAHANYPPGPGEDPTGPEISRPVARVMRGGNWANLGAICSSGNRGNFRPGDAFDIFGFRVVQEIG